MYGKRRRVVETRVISGGTGTGTAIDEMARLRWKPRKRYTVDCDRSSHSVGLYDVVSLDEPVGPSSDGAGTSGQRTVCVGIEYGLHDNRLTLLEV